MHTTESRGFRAAAAETEIPPERTRCRRRQEHRPRNSPVTTTTVDVALAKVLAGGDLTRLRVSRGGVLVVNQGHRPAPEPFTRPRVT